MRDATRRPFRLTPRQRLAASVLLVGALALAPVRAWLEASMTLHMLMQMPLLVLAGFAAADASPPHWRSALHRFAGGSLPLALAAMLASSYWMLPRALDAALIDPWAETAKFASLPLLVGAPLALAWERLGPIGRGFLWTNFFSMLAMLGWLYIAAPVRVCNSYLVGEQAIAGWSMVYLAIALFVGWLSSFFVGGQPAAGEAQVPCPSATGETEDDDTPPSARRNGDSMPAAAQDGPVCGSTLASQAPMSTSSGMHTA